MNCISPPRLLTQPSSQSSPLPWLPGGHVDVVSDGGLVLLQELVQVRQPEDEDPPAAGVRVARPEDHDAVGLDHVKLDGRANRAVEQKDLKVLKYFLTVLRFFDFDT